MTPPQAIRERHLDDDLVLLQRAHPRGHTRGRRASPIGWPREFPILLDPRLIEQDRFGADVVSLAAIAGFSVIDDARPRSNVYYGLRKTVFRGSDSPLWT